MNLTKKQQEFLKLVLPFDKRFDSPDFLFDGSSCSLMLDKPRTMLVNKVNASLHDLKQLGEEDFLTVTERIDLAYFKVTKKAADAVESNFGTAPSQQTVTLKKRDYPVEITESLAKFREVHQGEKTAFIMMKFEDTPLQTKALEEIVGILKWFKITGLRADERNFHRILHFNIMTYMHGCDFGVAMYDRAVKNDFNPNVAFEVGYMMALEKPICLLKDDTITELHTDLGGLTYRPFNLQNSSDTVGRQINNWLHDVDHKAYPKLIGVDLFKNWKKPS